MTDSTTPGLTDTDYQALARFRHALRLFLRFSERAARDEGITPNQHQLLLAVRGSPPPHPPSVGALAELLQVRLHSAVGLVDRAEDAGLVVSHRDAEDARRRVVELTTLGATILERLSELHRQELQRFRSDMADVLDEIR